MAATPATLICSFDSPPDVVGEREETPDYLNSFLENPPAVLGESQPLFHTTFGTGRFKDLGRCSCQDFDDSQRSELAHFVTDQLPTDTKLLRITFLGSGFLLCETEVALRCLQRLHAEEWKGDFEVTIIDHKYLNPNQKVQKALDAFARILVENLDPTCTFHLNIEHDVPEQIETDVLVAIDPGYAFDREKEWSEEKIAVVAALYKKSSEIFLSLLSKET